MKNIACISILLTEHLKYTYVYLFKFVLYCIVAFKANNKLNGHKTVICAFVVCIWHKQVSHDVAFSIYDGLCSCKYVTFYTFIADSYS